MPQFDNGSFSNQIIFFFLFFINCYFLITYFFLPAICKNLKFRKKKFNLTTEYLTNTQLETLKQQLFLNSKINIISDNFNTIVQKSHETSVLKVLPMKTMIFNTVGFKKSYLNFQTQFFTYPKYFN